MLRMKTLLLASVALGAASLGACVPQTGNPALDANIAQAQIIVGNLCNFEITAVEIANVLTVNPNVATADAIAKVICAAVSPPKATRYAVNRAGQTASADVVIAGHKVSVVGKFTR